MSVPLRLRAVEPVQDAGAGAHELAQVCRERDQDGGGHLIHAGHRDAERLAHGAAGAVGPHQVPGRELVGPGAGVDGRRDAPVALLQPEPPVAAPEVDERLGRDPVQQDRLERRLRDVQQGRGRHGEDIVVLALVGHGSEAVARQRRDEAHLAGELLRRGDRAQPLRADAELGGEDLDRPRVDRVRSRQRLRLERLLEHDRRHPSACEQERERDADHASAGDDHGLLAAVGHDDAQ